MSGDYKTSLFLYLCSFLFRQCSLTRWPTFASFTSVNTILVLDLYFSSYGLLTYTNLILYISLLTMSSLLIPYFSKFLKIHPNATHLCFPILSEFENPLCFFFLVSVFCYVDKMPLRVFWMRSNSFRTIHRLLLYLREYVNLLAGASL